MTSRASNMFKNILVKAFYYIVHADGKIDDKEIALGKKMIIKERIDETEFNEKMESFSKQKQDILFVSLKEDLKKLTRREQIKIIAYMANAANADGFMDPSEWRLIYKLYKEELDLPLQDILSTQKHLPPFGT